MAKSARRVSKRKSPKKFIQKTIKRKAVREEKARKRGSFWKRQQAARKGWETRRERAAERERERQRRTRVRRARAKEKAEKEARRLAKWRKSYREYLQFRVGKVERKELAIPEKKELVCRVVFDEEGNDELEDVLRSENIWTNVEYLLRQRVGQILAKIPGEEGIVKGLFRLIEGEEYERMQAGTFEDAEEGDYGRLIALEWELDIEPRLFWSNYYAHARELLPARAEKGGQDYKASWLGVVKLELCYAPGEAEG